MCGIAGFFSNDINFEVNDKYRKILVQMKKSLYHRGPDDSGIYLKEHCGFAHTRLAIRDVKYGRQPMKRTINNKDRKSTRLNSSHRHTSRMPSSA